MNTIDARQRLVELSERTITIVEKLASGQAISSQDASDMRDILGDARAAAYDAGYPGDAAWRALLRTSVYIAAPPIDVEMEFWSEMLEDLEEGIRGLVSITETAAEA